VEAVFIDCDDTLYQNNGTTMDKITDAMAAWTHRNLGVTREETYQLYKTYGSSVRGLLVEGKIDEAGAEKFLRAAHKIDYSDISPDPRLRSVLERICAPGRPPCYIFTASAAEHAERCLKRLGLADLGWAGIIDTRSCKFETKYSKSSFEIAMATAGVSSPAACLFFDDCVRNIKAARDVGWRPVLVGMTDCDDAGTAGGCPEAAFYADSLHHLPDLVPELFHGPPEDQKADAPRKLLPRKLRKLRKFFPIAKRRLHRLSIEKKQIVAKDGHRALSALDRLGIRVDGIMPGMFALVSFMFALAGFRKCCGIGEPARGLQGPLLHS
jgi:putative hydrolase of the HAD superfamily/pyrimidine and pyridine-specific 5'-nucleotidase